MSRTLFLTTIMILFALKSWAVTIKTDFQLSPPKYYKYGREVKGICYDIMQELNKRLADQDIEIVAANPKDPFSPFKQIRHDLEHGQIQVFIGIAMTDERQGTYQYASTPIYEIQTKFAKISGDGFEFEDGSELNGKRVAILDGTRTSMLLAQFEGISLLTTNKLSTAFEKLIKGHVDLVFYHSLGLRYTAKTLRISKKIELTKNSLETYYHYIAFNNDVPSDIVDAVDTAIRSMRDDGTIVEIIESYLE